MVSLSIRAAFMRDVEKINAVAELLFAQFEVYVFSVRGPGIFNMASVAFLGRMDRPMTLSG